MTSNSEDNLVVIIAIIAVVTLGIAVAEEVAVEVAEGGARGAVVIVAAIELVEVFQ
jgi:hypothetical protein